MAGHRTPLTIKHILAWADAHHKRTGSWPTKSTGSVHEAPDEKWSALSQALRNGARGLSSGGSLARLLAKHGRKRNRIAQPRLSIKQVLAWSDAHHSRTGQWPKRFSGKVYGTRDETWLRIDRALRHGVRGFSGGHSLPKLLSERRGARHTHGDQDEQNVSASAHAFAKHRGSGDSQSAQFNVCDRKHCGQQSRVYRIANSRT